MTIDRWLVYAFLSAISAAFVGIFGKAALREVDSTLATVIRSIVMSLLLVGVATASNLWPKLSGIHAKAFWAIVLSGTAGALSWLFYFKAIQVGTVSQVAPIDKLSMPLAILLAVVLLGDRPSRLNWLGIALIVAGAFLAAAPRLKAS